ncbi:unnamed protein product [Acanthoscelides obtectus]|uniref:Uncharacterized protein n=1 Tax=Acanthoscelides obtectus TaxID=200917 RepID=A0A9P0P4L6_ACAOB|nr:unnamed protein product [Acanthoscelides obtectus]CAK1627455.1 hypothetical protein AOBTE_LOCUS4613 [Acanthoscelides obtectus]
MKKSTGGSLEKGKIMHLYVYQSVYKTVTICIILGLLNTKYLQIVNAMRDVKREALVSKEF